MVSIALFGLEWPSLVLVVVALLVILVVRSWARTPAKLPPCPARPYPVLGHLVHMAKDPVDTWCHHDGLEQTVSLLVCLFVCLWTPGPHGQGSCECHDGLEQTVSLLVCLFVCLWTPGPHGQGSCECHDGLEQTVSLLVCLFVCLWTPGPHGQGSCECHHGLEQTVSLLVCLFVCLSVDTWSTWPRIM